jgi:tRNA(Ile)-lysidine synthase
MTRQHKQNIPLEARVLESIHRHHLLEKPGRIVVAVSGGPDSVCLLHVLLNLKETLNIDIHIAHLNHQLRGVDSRRDAQFVSGLARSSGIPYTIAERDVRRFRDEHHLTLEEAAREVRYAFLLEVVKAVSADVMAVGHTRDDNVETILLHLIRGTGTRGLRGLQPASRWLSSTNSIGNMTVVRPLYDITREETAGYCREHNLAFRIDRTNLSVSLLRNRIRLKLLPELRHYNPKIDDALLRMAQTAGDEFDFFQKESSRLWRKIAEERHNTIILNKRKLLRQSTALQRYLLRMSLEKTIGNLKDIETRHVEDMLHALRKRSGTTIVLPDGLVFAVEYNRFLITHDPAALCPFPALKEESCINVPGETDIPGWHITAKILPFSVLGSKNTSTPDNIGLLLSQRAYPEGVTLSLSRMESGLVEGVSKRDFTTSEGIRFSACFDFDKVGEKITVRSYQTGDRFQPLGLGQSKKVGQFMVDARIPRWWRDRVPVISSSQHIIWVAGWRIDDRVSIADTSKNILSLEFKLLSPDSN